MKIFQYHWIFVKKYRISILWVIISLSDFWKLLIKKRISRDLPFHLKSLKNSYTFSKLWRSHYDSKKSHSCILINFVRWVWFKFLRKIIWMFLEIISKKSKINITLFNIIRYILLKSFQHNMLSIYIYQRKKNILT